MEGLVGLTPNPAEPPDFWQGFSTEGEAMLKYFNVVFVLEYLRTNGVSQRTQDRVLALLWKEAQSQQKAEAIEMDNELPEFMT